MLVYVRSADLGEEVSDRPPEWMYPSWQAEDVNAPDLTGAGGAGARAVPMDRRDFGIGGQILRDLGLTRLRVLTNAPKLFHHLQAFGLEVVESVPIEF